MSDNDTDRIVRMLRVSESDPVQQEAADEIERLRAELVAEREKVAKLREALEPILNSYIDDPRDSDAEQIFVSLGDLRRARRAVLETKP